MKTSSNDRKPPDVSVTKQRAALLRLLKLLATDVAKALIRATKG